MKVLFSDFLYSGFWQMKIGAKAARNMLVKLTTGLLVTDNFTYLQRKHVSLFYTNEEI
jgi:hypothetical protein